MGKYSQGEQDDWLVEHFKGRTGVAVDVGANDGTFYSNTLRLEELGWRVLCIEPNVRCVGMLHAKRKEAIICAVSDYDGIGALKVMASQNGVNASGTALEPIEDRPILAVDVVKVRTLDTLLEEAGIERLDFVTLDCEGGELAALRGLDIDRYRPEVIIVERNDVTGVEGHLGERYKEAARTDSDTIYVRAVA